MLGNTKLRSNVILAPMAGVTDLPFRRTVRQFGPFLMYSEMIASQAVIRNVAKTRVMMNSDNDPLTAVQIVGADPLIMADAAKLSYDLGAKIIDINMGCPVRKIIKSEAGSALMKNEQLASSIIKAVVNAVPIPITIKIRLGWDDEYLNAPNIAHIAEESGIRMITVHGRTRSQLYAGKANWKQIKEVKNAIKIPLIVNGDITNITTAKQALQESEADGVMIGRGSLGSPWILKEVHQALNNEPVVYISEFDKYKTAQHHIQHVLDFYPNNIGITLAKKVLVYYCKGKSNATKYRSLIFSSDIKNSRDIFNTLDEIFEMHSATPTI